MSGSRPVLSARPRRAGRTPGVPLMLLVALAGALALASLAGVAIGTTHLPLRSVIDALVAYDGTSREHVVIVHVRLPRVLAGVLVGSALATAGAIMQAVTGNPLASPGILGINAGAAFAVVLLLVSVGDAAGPERLAAAFAGRRAPP